jgi:hypothetical protein
VDVLLAHPHGHGRVLIVSWTPAPLMPLLIRCQKVSLWWGSHGKFQS